MFSHPHDFTPVCTTELARAAQLQDEFKKRNVKLLALSCNDVQMHKDWIKDIEAYGQLDTSKAFPFPIIDDRSRHLANKLGMIDPDELDSAGIPLTARAVSISLFNFSLFYFKFDSPSLYFLVLHCGTGQEVEIEHFVSSLNRKKFRVRRPII